MKFASLFLMFFPFSIFSYADSRGIFRTVNDVECGIAPNHTGAFNDMVSRAVESSRYMLSDVQDIAMINPQMSVNIKWDELVPCRVWVTDKVQVRFVPKDMRECTFIRDMEKTMLYQDEKEIDSQYLWGQQTEDCKFPESSTKR